MVGHERGITLPMSSGTPRRPRHVGRQALSAVVHPHLPCDAELCPLHLAAPGAPGAAAKGCWARSHPRYQPDGSSGGVGDDVASTQREAS